MISETGCKVKIYRNNDVEELIIAIPRNHKHIRLLIKFKDQAILLNEAVVSAIVKSYLLITLDPIRRGIVLKQVILDKERVKKNYDTVQLIEIPNSENEAIDTITRIIEENNQ